MTTYSTEYRELRQQAGRTLFEQGTLRLCRGAVPAPPSTGEIGEPAAGDVISSHAIPTGVGSESSGVLVYDLGDLADATASLTVAAPDYVIISDVSGKNQGLWRVSQDAVVVTQNGSIVAGQNVRVRFQTTEGNG